MKGLQNHSRRPRISPNQTSEDVFCDLARFKTAHSKWRPKKIRELYCRSHSFQVPPSLTTVKQILDKAELVEHRERRSRTKTQRLQNRIITEKPKDLWTVDFKGWWYTPDGAKCEPLTVRDDYSKYILSIKALQKATAKEVKTEFEKRFAINGVLKVIRFDNGSPFASVRGLLGLTKLSVYWLALCIELDRITPGKPQENGRHERIHWDIKRELQGQIQGDLKQHHARFDIWRNEFNRVRTHEFFKNENT